MAWAIVYYSFLGSPEPQLGNSNSSHASLFCNSQYGNIGYNTGKQNRKSTYPLISVQYHTVFLTLIQNLFVNRFYLGIRRHNLNIMDFYILIDNAKQGPFPVEELANRNITPNTMVWTIGFSNWKQAKDVPELSELLSNMPPELPKQKPMPKTWMVESILVTCLCCLPLGIIGIVYATKVETAYYNQQYKLAQYYSSKARKWTLWGFCIALILFVIYSVSIILYILAPL